MDIHNINRIPESNYFNNQYEEVAEEKENLKEQDYVKTVREQMLADDIEQINQAARSTMKSRILSGDLHKDIASKMGDAVNSIAQEVGNTVEDTLADTAEEVVTESLDTIVEELDTAQSELVESIQQDVDSITKFVDEKEEELYQASTELLEQAQESVHEKIAEGKEILEEQIDSGMESIKDTFGTVDKTFQEVKNGYASLTDSIADGYGSGSAMAEAWQETASDILDVAQERWSLNKSKVFSSTCKDNSRLPNGSFPVQAFYENKYHFVDKEGNVTSFDSFIENSDLLSQKRDSEVLRLLFPVGMFDSKSSRAAPIYDAQMGAFFQDKKAQKQLHMAFESFLQRYSLKWDSETQKIVVDIEDFIEKQNHTAWLNNLFTKKRQIRIFDRVIKCLSMHGFKNESKELHLFLKDYIKPNMRNRSIEWLGKVGGSIMKNIVIPVLKILESNS